MRSYGFVLKKAILIKKAFLSPKHTFIFV